MEAFTLPLANNMKAIWAVSLRRANSILDYQQKNGTILFDVFTCQNKDPGFHFLWNYTLKSQIAMHFLCYDHYTDRQYSNQSQVVVVLAVIVTALTPNRQQRAATKADFCVALSSFCLDRKVALRHTAKTTANGSLARTSCMRGNGSPYQHLVVVCNGHSEWDTGRLMNDQMRWSGSMRQFSSRSLVAKLNSQSQGYLSATASVPDSTH